MVEDIIVDYEGVKKVLKWILDEFTDNHHIVTLDELYDRYGFGTGQTLFWCLTVKHSWVIRGIAEKIVPTIPYKTLLEVYEDNEDSDKPSLYFTILSEKDSMIV